MLSVEEAAYLSRLYLDCGKFKLVWTSEKNVTSYSKLLLDSGF